MAVHLPFTVREIEGGVGTVALHTTQSLPKRICFCSAPFEAVFLGVHKLHMEKSEFWRILEKCAFCEISHFKCWSDNK